VGDSGIQATLRSVRARVSSERFYFQSFEAPLDRSEYLLVVPAAMRVDQDRRAGVPEPTAGPGPDGLGLCALSRANAPALPRARVGCRGRLATLGARVERRHLARWSRFLSDRLYTVARVSPELRRVAAQIVDAAGGARAKIPEAIITWVNQHIEPEPAC